MIRAVLTPTGWILRRPMSARGRLSSHEVKTNPCSANGLRRCRISGGDIACAFQGATIPIVSATLSPLSPKMERRITSSFWKADGRRIRWAVPVGLMG